VCAGAAWIPTRVGRNKPWLVTMAGEDGPIAAKYGLRATPSASYFQRTEWSVRDSDGAAIFTTSAKLAGGSKRTGEFADKHRKPWIHISARRRSHAKGVRRQARYQGSECRRNSRVERAGDRQWCEEGAGDGVRCEAVGLNWRGVRGLRDAARAVLIVPPSGHSAIVVSKTSTSLSEF